MSGIAFGGLARSDRLKPGESRALAGAFLLLLAMLGVTALNALFGVGGRAAEGPIRNWLSSAIYVVVAAIVAFRAIRVPAKGRSWAVFALGLSLYAPGNLLWSFWIGNLHNPPTDSSLGPDSLRSEARSCSSPSRPPRWAARPLWRRSWPIRSATSCSRR